VDTQLQGEASLQAMVAQLTERLDEVEQANAALREEVAALRSAQAAANTPTAGTGHTKRQGIPRTSRRTLLQLGGAAAAAGVAVAATGLAGHAPSALAAADNDGQPVLMGSSFINQCETGTWFAPSLSSSPAILLSADNLGSTTSDTLHACGVYGRGPSGCAGVRGVANGSGAKGVWGQSDAGIAVLAESGSGIDLWAGGTGIIMQGSQSFVGAPTSGAHFPGEQIRDNNADMWICVEYGTPGIWRRVVSVANGTVGGAMNFLPGITRIVTSGNTSDPGVPMVVGSPQTFPIAGHAGIPANATGVFGSATCYASSGTGFVSVFPAGGSATGGSLSFTAGDEPLSNFVATGLGTNGAITVATFASGCKFIYDAVGYTL
jgi:hypothetical protein